MRLETGPRFIGEATPYFYLGDSHAMVGSLVFDAVDEHIVTSSHIIRGFAARDLLDSDERLGDDLVQTLRRIGALSSHPDYPAIDGLPKVYSTDGVARIAENLTVTNFANDRPYVLCVGEIDTRYLARWCSKESIDFDLPFAVAGLDRLPAFIAAQRYRADEMLKLLAQHYNPLFRGLRILRAAGVRSVYLHAIPPPTLDDVAAARVIGVEVPARLRYKLAMSVNYIYSVVCADIGMGFIDTWPMVTRDGLLDEEYYLDGFHLNRQHSEVSVREVYRQFTAHRSLSAGPSH